MRWRQIFARLLPPASRLASRLIPPRPRNVHAGNCSTITTPATPPPPLRKLSGNSVRIGVYNHRWFILAKGATMPGQRFPLLCVAGLLSIVLTTNAQAATPEAYDPWPGLVQDIFNDRPINDGNNVIAIEMPYRAEDAAI